ncbi:peptidoglycan D,D-transpeptidase FtsI family protein [Nocardioides speluncae]|uniref:peptidoglycan D,D-transpeptidase FtsI family protein n=1 Tax=Nocardioides speluncae TaxID=2670337 RepID=UPI001F0CC451|nr:penicillin-binding protein 2 [Nocardioides speluncae]
MSPPRGGSALFRLRFGFVAIAIVLSIYGARLVQLQGLDPKSYAAMAAAEGVVSITLPADRGAILDRDGEPLAESVDGLMIVADPKLTTEHAPYLAKELANELGLDYFTTLKALSKPDTRFQYIARRVPATQALNAVERLTEAGYKGLATERDPLRDYTRDVAANLLGYMGTDGEPLGGMELTFDKILAGKDGSARYEVGGGNRIPLGDNQTVKPVDGKDLKLTIDLDLQWFVQRVLRQTVLNARAESGMAVVMDTRTGEVLALADDPTFDANGPLRREDKSNLGSRAMSDVYEPGSVEKVLTLAALLDAGKVTPWTKILVPPELPRQDRVIHDHWDHGNEKLTLTGVLAKSSNIGTVLAADQFEPAELHGYLDKFGFGQRTKVGVRGETAGMLSDPDTWSQINQDTIAFGQGVSVNALQMAAAINTVANGGVRVSPSLVRGSAVTDQGEQVGTDVASPERVLSEKAARQTAQMMEKVVDPEDGTAPKAAVPDYRVAGKTGTAQRVNPECGCYEQDAFDVSFAGFAPADDPRFTVYVVLRKPGVAGGGGSLAGPAFSTIMQHALRRYSVPPTGTKAPDLPVTWTRR